MAKTSEIKIGDRIGDQYEVYRIFGGEGKSGMGIVYVCYDHESKQILALKTFQQRFLSSKEAINDFKHEALAWVHLDRHPYIVRAHATQEMDYRIFIILEYIAPDKDDRNNLTHYLKNPISLEKTLEWGMQFCRGMEYNDTLSITNFVLSSKDII